MANYVLKLFYTNDKTECVQLNHIQEPKTLANKLEKFKRYQHEENGFITIYNLENTYKFEIYDHDEIIKNMSF